MTENNDRRNPYADPDALIPAMLISRQRILIASRNIVGQCHNLRHPGKLTRALMEEHDCLNKQCPFFKKNDNAAYWLALEKKNLRKTEARAQLAEHKRQRVAQNSRFEEMRARFQTCADEAGYALRIVRVNGLRATIYIYYVSDYPFADGNRFPAFIKSVRALFPHHRIMLRHIRDQRGHFLTREEYARIRR